MRLDLNPLSFRLPLLFLLAVWALGCQRVTVEHQESYVFGTRVEVLVAESDPETARKGMAAVLREFDRLHRTYHAWQPSELTELNAQLTTGQPVAIKAEMAALLRESQEFTRQGNGLFDPGIGKLIQLWGFQRDEFEAKVPSQAAIDQWLSQRSGIADLDIGEQSVQARKPGVALDFGGYLKGVALDRAAVLLREAGIRHALINIGGNILALGNKGGQAWKVGIQHPRRPGPLATLQLADGEAIGTSGDYQRYFESEGRRYAHLLDPRTGWPPTHTQAITIVVPAGNKAGTLSDAASKPIYLGGPQGWRPLAKQQGIEQVLRVDAEGHVQVTEALAKRLEWVDKTIPVEVLP